MLLEGIKFANYYQALFPISSWPSFSLHICSPASAQAAPSVCDKNSKIWSTPCNGLLISHASLRMWVKYRVYLFKKYSTKIHWSLARIRASRRPMNGVASFKSHQFYFGQPGRTDGMRFQTQNRRCQEMQSMYQHTQEIADPSTAPCYCYVLPFESLRCAQFRLQTLVQVKTF